MTPINSLKMTDTTEKNAYKLIHSFLALTLFLVVFSGHTWAQSQYIENIPYEIAPIEAPFEMPQLKRPEFPAQTFNIRDYGATEMHGGEKNKSTTAIERAIEAAHKAGGGKVVIPKGEWLTGPIHLMSNINLHLEEGAIVYFSEDKADYLPVVRVRYEGVEAYNYSPLIYAYKLKNVAITGKGILDGRGEHWWKWSTVQPRAIATKAPLSKREFGKGAGKEGMRPNFVVFLECENVLVEDITLNDTPMWNVHLVYSKNIIVRGITVNSLEAPNGDGICIDSSSDVLVEYNHLKTGDDAVVIKSGFNEEGLAIDIPTENVVIRNFYAYDVRTGSGGVVFGSETSGGIRNVYVHNALFENCDRGIRFKTERGRGNVIENIYVRDIELKDIRMEAINFNTFYTGPGVVGPSPSVRNIHISDILVDGVPEPIVMIGLPEKWLEDITLENIKITNAKEGARLTRVKNLVMKNVAIHSQEKALVADDVYEFTIEDLMLSDKEKGPDMLLKGLHTGAVFINDDFPKNKIAFEDGLTSDVLRKEKPVQTW